MRLRIFRFKKDKPLINVLFRRILLLMIIAAFITSLLNAINSAFITAFYNNNGSGMAAMSLSLTTIGFMDIFVAVLTTGTQAKSAGAMANADKKRANEFVSAGVVLGIIVGLVFFFIGFFAAQGIAKGLALNQSADIQELTEAYLKGFAICAPFYFLNSILRPVAILDGNRPLVFVSLAAIFVVDIVANFINAYVVKGGLFGVAFSTSIAYIVSSLILCLHFFRKKSCLVFKASNFNFKTSIVLIKRGFINITKALCTWAFQLYTNYVLLKIGGPTALTILGIQANCFSIVNSLVDGVYNCGFMLNHVYGAEEDDKAIYDLASLLYRFTIYFVGIISLVFVIIAPQIATAYQITDQAEFDQLVLAIRCSIAVVPFVAYQQIMIVFMPIRDCNIAFILRIAVLPIIMTSILGFTVGVDGFWIGNAVGACLYIVIHPFIGRHKYHHWPHTLTEMFFLADDFGYQYKSTLRININSQKDCDTLLREVMVFAKTMPIGEDRAKRLVTCTKAICDSYRINHANNANKKHRAEAIVCYKNDAVSIRIRDNSDFDFNNADFLSSIDLKSEKKQIATLHNNSTETKFINVLNISNLCVTI